MKKQSGFTLIELMVATAISAVIAVLAYQSVDSISRLKTAVDQKQRQLSLLQRAFWKMEADFSQMAPRPVTDALGSPLPAVQALPEGQVSLTRVVAEPSPHQVGGLLRLDYVLEGDKLYRQVWPVLDRAPDSQPQKVLLLAGVKSLQWRFYDAKHQPHLTWPPEQVAGSEEEADSRLTQMPLAVEVTLVWQATGQGGEARHEENLDNETVSITRFFSGIDMLPTSKAP